MSYLKHFLGAHEEARRRRFKDYKYVLEDRLRIAYIYSKRDVELENNTNMYLDVKSVSIQKNNIILICPYIRHPLGSIISVGEDIPLPITSERSIDKVLFAVGSDGVMKKGDLVGAVLFIPVDEADAR